MRIFAPAAAMTILLLAADSAHAQGVQYHDIVLNPSGRPAAAVTVTVCPPTGSGYPCLPTTTIYTDTTLTTPAPNPFTTDGLGNYSFNAPPGQYLVTISGYNIITHTTNLVSLACTPAICGPTRCNVTMGADFGALINTCLSLATTNGTFVADATTLSGAQSQITTITPLTGTTLLLPSAATINCTVSNAACLVVKAADNFTLVGAPGTVWNLNNSSSSSPGILIESNNFHFDPRGMKLLRAIPLSINNNPMLQVTEPDTVTTISGIYIQDAQFTDTLNAQENSNNADSISVLQAPGNPNPIADVYIQRNTITHSGHHAIQLAGITRFHEIENHIFAPSFSALAQETSTADGCNPHVALTAWAKDPIGSGTTGIATVTLPSSLGIQPGGYVQIAGSESGAIDNMAKVLDVLTPTSFQILSSPAGPTSGAAGTVWNLSCNTHGWVEDNDVEDYMAGGENELIGDGTNGGLQLNMELTDVAAKLFRGAACNQSSAYPCGGIVSQFTDEHINNNSIYCLTPGPNKIPRRLFALADSVSIGNTSVGCTANSGLSAGNTVIGSNYHTVYADENIYNAEPGTGAYTINAFNIPQDSGADCGNGHAACVWNVPPCPGIGTTGACEGDITLHDDRVHNSTGLVQLTVTEVDAPVNQPNYSGVFRQAIENVTIENLHMFCDLGCAAAFPAASGYVVAFENNGQDCIDPPGATNGCNSLINNVKLINNDWSQVNAANPGTQLMKWFIVTGKTPVGNILVCNNENKLGLDDRGCYFMADAAQTPSSTCANRSATLGACTDSAGVLQLTAGSGPAPHTGQAIYNFTGLYSVAPKCSVTDLAHPLPWQNSTSYPAAAVVLTPIGMEFFNITAGTNTSGSAEPSWLTAAQVGATVTDAAITWQNIGNPVPVPQISALGPNLWQMTIIGPNNSDQVSYICSTIPSIQ